MNTVVVNYSFLFEAGLDVRTRTKGKNPVDIEIWNGVVAWSKIFFWNVLVSSDIIGFDARAIANPGGRTVKVISILGISIYGSIGPVSSAISEIP